MTDRPPRLAVAVVNWRAAPLAIDCLASIEREIADLPGSHVFVVDNDSRDGSAEAIERAIAEHAWSDWATLIRAPSNAGFAAGNNIVIRRVLAERDAFDYVLLLNPDTVVRDRTFRILLDFMTAHPEVGIAGGRSEDPDATPQACSFRFPNIVSEFALYLSLGPFEKLFERFMTYIGIPEASRPVDWVSGALMIVRMPVFEDIGLMDEAYFLYYEETDFTHRARAAGWTCWHVPESRVVHLVGQSTGVTTRDGPPRRRPPYWFESRRRYFVLNHGLLYTAVADIMVVLGYMLRRLREILQGRKNDLPPHFLRDFIQHSVLLRGRRGLDSRQID